MAAHHAFAEEAYGLPRGEMEIVDRSLLETFEVFNGVDYSTTNFQVSLQPNAHIMANMTASNDGLSASNPLPDASSSHHGSVEPKPQSRKGAKGANKGEDPAIVARDRRRYNYIDDLTFAHL